MADKLKIAGAQMEPALLEKESNLSRCLGLLETAAAQGAQLVVFPECTLTGYVFASMKEALPACETVPGPSTENILAACRRLNVYAVAGLLERDGGRFYNTAVLIGPQGLVGKHRKLHLPYIAVDRFLNHGNLPPTIYETEVGRIGLGICYDLMFPEFARVLTVKGADLIVLPTNWPELGEVFPDLILPARAFENHVFCAAVNRVGEERGVKFFGRSTIVDWIGLTVAEGKAYQEDLIFGEIEPETSRERYMQVIPGEFEMHFDNDRRPEFYGALVEPLADDSRIR